MTERRKTLSLRLSAKTPDEPALDPEVLIEQAIAHHLCVRWSYNRTMMQAAPQILYRKKSGVYLDAIVIERGGRGTGRNEARQFQAHRPHQPRDLDRSVHTRRRHRHCRRAL